MSERFTKIVIYNLPPTFKENTFWESISGFQKLCDFKCFVQGRIGLVLTL
jgi:hypothetical protein